jgi:hypothetical protein
MKKIFRYITPALLLAITATGCKKDYLEVAPQDAASLQKVFGTVATANAAIDGMYNSMFEFAPGNALAGTGHDNYGQKSWDLSSDLMGQDMVIHAAGYGWYNRDYQFNEWNLPNNTRRPDEVWFYYYNLIKQALIMNEAADGIKDATPAQKGYVKGQALAMRAYSYFYLVNYFQQTYKGNENAKGVPLAATFVIENRPRGTVQQVYDLIISDLTQAETFLTGFTATNKKAITKSVVQGLRARVALIMEDWANAATYAAAARQGYTLMSGAQLTSAGAFSNIAANPEVLWGSIIPTTQSTIYASFYSHMDINTNGYAALGQQKKITKALYDQIAATDVRKAWWKGSAPTASDPLYNQRKLRVPVPGSWAADYTYMRAAEMYLIEAEAKARLAQDAGARTALEGLMTTRVPGYSAAALSGTALLNEILLQRRIELWGEGFSLMDIKRLKTGVNRPTGTGNHNATESLNPIVLTLPDASPLFLMKIPQREMDANLVFTAADQNP